MSSARGCCTSPSMASCWRRPWNCRTTCGRPIIRSCITHADMPRLPHSRGLEAMDLAGDNKTLVSILEGTVAGDAPKAAARAALRHRRRKVAAPHSYICARRRHHLRDRHVAHRRQPVRGRRARRPAGRRGARQARLLHRSRSRPLPGKPLQKKLVIDLLSIGNSRGLVVTTPAGAPFRFPYLTTESIQVLDRKHVVIVNDNNYPATGGRGADRQRRHGVDLARTRQSVVRSRDLIALKDAELAFGLTPLLDRASLAIQAGDRVGLIGRNGTGKSSLLGALLGTHAARRRRGAAQAGARHRQRRAGTGAAAGRNAARVAGAARRVREHARRPAALGARGAAQRIPAAFLGQSRRIAGLRVRRRAQTRGARAGIRDRARSHAARRAHQPSRRRRHRDARRAAAAERHLHRHHARPALPRQGGEFHRRARSRHPAHASRATTRCTRSARPRSTSPRISRIAASRSSGRRKKSGFARVSRRAARATKAA